MEVGHAVGRLENLVELREELVVGSQVVQKTLRDDYTPIVLSLGSPLANSVANAVHDVGESLSAIGALFRDYHHVGTRLERTLEGQVGRLLTHKSDEVPVLDGRGAIC